MLEYYTAFILMITTTTPLAHHPHRPSTTHSKQPPPHTIFPYSFFLGMPEPEGATILQTAANY